MNSNNLDPFFQKLEYIMKISFICLINDLKNFLFQDPRSFNNDIFHFLFAIKCHLQEFREEGINITPQNIFQGLEIKNSISQSQKGISINLGQLITLIDYIEKLPPREYFSSDCLKKILEIFKK